MVISSPIACLLAAALGPTALYQPVPVSRDPEAALAAALVTGAMLIAVLARPRTPAAPVPAIRRGRRR